MTAITKPRALADILKKHDPPPPQPYRPATPLEYRHVGTRDGCPVYELHAVCDDGQARWFTQGPDGRWIRKEQPHATQ